MKLIGKLSLAMVATACLVLSVHGALGVSRERALFEQDMERDEHLIGRVLGAAVAETWKRDGEQEALRVIAGASDRPEGVRVRWVWLDDAAPAEHRAEVALGELAAQGATTRVVRVVRGGDGTSRFVTYVPVEVGTARRGAIEVSEPLGEEEQYIAESIERTVLTTLALVLLTGALGWMLSRWMVGRPMAALIDKMRRMGEGDLSGPLALAKRDEIGALASAIDRTCDQLGALQAEADAETRARIAALEQLRHADRLTTVGKLASGLAHELGTPLNVVAGRAKMIRRGLPKEETEDSARIVVEQTERMTKIIRQLLDFARKRSPQMAPTNLTALTVETAAMLEPLAKKRGVTLRVEDRPPLTVCADGSQLQQVLTNLVMNAVHASASGGVVTLLVERARRKPPVDIGGPEAEHVALRVRDAGAGIPEENLGRVFEPFFTTKDVGEGTGLGLSVSQGIVEEHGGSIDVASTVGVGTTFTVYLPIAETEETPGP